MVDQLTAEQKRIEAMEARLAKLEELSSINKRDIGRAFGWMLLGAVCIMMSDRPRTKTQFVLVEPGSIERFKT